MPVQVAHSHRELLFFPKYLRLCYGFFLLAFETAFVGLWKTKV